MYVKCNYLISYALQLKTTQLTEKSLHIKITIFICSSSSLL